MNFNELATGTTLTTGSTPPRVAGTAAASVKVRIVAVNGGSATVQTLTSTTPANRLLRLPTDADVAAGKFFAVAVQNATSTEAMNIGYAPFSWQAEFSKDAVVAGDDGDNVFQRGFAGDTQWKLQADSAKVTCRLSSNVGTYTTVITPSSSITPGVMYRAKCTRSLPATGTCSAVDQGQKLALDLWRFSAPDTWTKVETKTVCSAPMNITFGNVLTPVSVAGKVTSALQMASTGDQLSGRVDNIALTVFN